MVRVLAALLISALPMAALHGQSRFVVTDIAQYRLTLPVLERFEEASRLVMAVTRADPRFAHAPLFTREVALSGEVVAMATGLAARLENEPALVAALSSAKLTSHEYVTFAITLFAAHLAHGFIDAGVLPRVPDGPPTQNVAFVDAHEARIAAVLDVLGVAN